PAGKPAVNMPGDRHGPGVRIHPPIIFAASILAGYGINVLWPLAMPFGRYGKAVAIALLVTVLVIAGFCLREFYRAKTDVRPDRPDTALITTGPYTLSRNPLYLMLIIVQLMVAAWMNMAWIALTSVASVIIMTRYAIAREERYLEQLFGQDYRDYKARVRRWF
ncbi:MAG: isoprenylcysteine carboxylmethyltransferase family protein, partial [Gammaproteobacteria bacterium]